jgi:RNA polymerase sigma-70 factor (ECF subfamily)
VELISNVLRERIQSGDSTALAELLDQYRSPLLAFINSRLGPAMKTRVEADDIFQDLSVVALNRLADLSVPSCEPFAWLCHLSEQRIIDTHRRLFGAQKRAANRQVPLNSPLGGDSGGTLEDLLVSSLTSASAMLSRSQKQMRVLVAIQQLPAKQQEILRLRYTEGLTTREIAERLGSSDAAIRVQLSRSVARLQELLGDS